MNSDEVREEELQELAQQATHSWGSTFWQTARVIALKHALPTSAKEFAEVRCVLKAVPCPNCRDHIIKLDAETSIQPYIGVRFGVVRYVFDLHNAVNRKLGKREVPYQEGLQFLAEELHDTMEEAEERKKAAPSTQKKLVMLGVGIAAGAAWFYSGRQAKRARMEE